MAKETDSVYAAPVLAAVPVQGSPAAAYVAVTVIPVPVAVIVVEVMLSGQDLPAYVMVRLFPVKTAAVPLFAIVTVPVVVAAAELNTAFVIDTLAVLPALPKIPNT